ncbi:MAG TPA: hypothetical protein VII66_03270 [Gemmatimonadaceae bacterium]
MRNRLRRRYGRTLHGRRAWRTYYHGRAFGTVMALSRESALAQAIEKAGPHRDSYYIGVEPL